MTESRFSDGGGEGRAGREHRGGPRTGRRRTGRCSSSDKRERILRAATRVFARKGFYAARVSEVAKAAGVADGTIYLYFKSKDELLISLFEDRVERLLDVIRRIVAHLDGPEAKLQRIIELQLGVLDEERDLAEVITVSLRQSTRLLRQYAAPKLTAYLEAIASVVAEGQQSGVFRGDVVPFDAARAVFGALDGLALTWALGAANPGGLRRTAGSVAEIFLHGLRRR